jgi:antitoxin ParD1/3/4
MPTRNVHLTEHFDNFIEIGVQSGRFSNASEVVREGLRLLEQRQEEEKAKLAWLQGAIQEGVDAAEHGEYTTLPTAGAVSDYLHRIRAS